jgi:hypothetical protein
MSFHSSLFPQSIDPPMLFAVAREIISAPVPA